MRYIELFAGGGGMSRGLEAAGMTCVAHAEIEPHARAILRQHWPDTPLHGDVTTVDWTAYAGQVDLVVGGSPCQDLSVAGKRAGLAGARSGLFFELIRAWEETRAPYCLWENVDGARSSNAGGDFAAVLSAFVGTALPVPSDGWRSSGVAAGPTGVAAWRVLDLQHFGPPQRRRRLFVLAARTGGVDPAEVLALSEGVCGHPSPRQQARERAAARTRGGAPSAGMGVMAFGNVGMESWKPTDVTVTASARDYKSPNDNVVGTQNEAVTDVNGATTAQTLRGFGHGWQGQHNSTNAVICNRHGADSGRPRRLTPLECERLMGWPDDWTRIGIDEHGAAYVVTDTNRYRICGNGVGSPCAEWIGRQLIRLVSA